MSSPTQRSLALLKKEGYLPWIVERFNAFGNNRVDLYGFIDIVCLRIDKAGILGVQTTSASGLSARVHKILGLPAYRLWLNCGNKIELHGWKKDKNGKWVVKRREITLEDE